LLHLVGSSVLQYKSSSYRTENRNTALLMLFQEILVFVMRWHFAHTCGKNGQFLFKNVVMSVGTAEIWGLKVFN